MQKDIERHRLSAFIHGLLSGLGLILIMWGLFSLIKLPSSSTNFSIGLTLIGVLMFAGGGFREAYIWGRFSAQQTIHKKDVKKRTRYAAPSKPTIQAHQTERTAQASAQDQTGSNRMITEQMKQYPAETQTHEAVVYEQEKQT